MWTPKRAPIVAQFIHLNSSKMRRQRDASLSLIVISIAIVISAAQTQIEELAIKSSSSEEDSVSGSSEDTVSDDLIFLARKSFQPTPDASDSNSASEEEEPVTVQTPPPVANVTPIDMSPFVALIPVRQVQAIAENYYRHDKEVQRAYAFLGSEYYAEMKERILQLPEVLAFTRYLNASGLDVLQLGQTVWLAMKPPATFSDQTETTTGTTELNLPGGIDAPIVSGENRSKELNGLHGLVDSVLDVLPQDQILATFFDKTETDQQFARLVDSIGTPKFSKILSNLQNSVPIRNLIFELHNNGIYITRIVESLKGYFLLSSF